MIQLRASLMSIYAGAKPNRLCLVTIHCRCALPNTRNSTRRTEDKHHMRANKRSKHGRLYVRPGLTCCCGHRTCRWTRTPFTWRRPGCRTTKHKRSRKCGQATCSRLSATLNRSLLACGILFPRCRPGLIIRWRRRKLVLGGHGIAGCGFCDRRCRHWAERRFVWRASGLLPQAEHPPE